METLIVTLAALSYVIPYGAICVVGIYAALRIWREMEW